MSEEKKKLDDFLDALQQYSVPAEPPQEAVDKLLERLAPKADSAMRYPSGRTSNKTIVKFAAAAIFFAVIIVSAVVFYNVEKDKIKNALKMPYKGSPVRQKDQQLEAVTKIKLQQELDQITKRYAARDVKGLIEVLDGGQYETKLAVAYFLGEIGDLPAAEAIEKYASLWTGNIEENPFTKAAAKIRNRLISKSVSASQIKKEINDMNKAAAAVEDQNTITFSGQVVDENYKPIENAAIRHKIFNYEEKPQPVNAYTDPNGNFNLKLKNDQNLLMGFIVAEHENYSIGWQQFTKSEGQNNFRKILIVLYEPQAASGIVVDETENPVKDAIVKISVSTADKKYQDYGMWVQTDENGRFCFEKLPKDSRFSIDVHKEGFIDYKRFGNHYLRAEQTDIKIVLARGLVIKCQFRLDGKKYYDPNVGVVVFENGQMSEIFGRYDQEGYFLINVERVGPYILKAYAKNNLMAVPIEIYVNKDTFAEISLIKGIPVDVKITDEKNNIIQNVKVQASWPNGELINYVKTNNGIGSIVLPKGDILINATVEIDGKKGTFDDVVTINDSTKEITLKFKGQLNEQQVYRLKDPNGNYVEGNLEVLYARFGVPASGVDPAKLKDVVTYTICRAYGSSNKYGKAFLWSPDSKNLDIQLEPLAKITGTIKDADQINLNKIRIDAFINDSYGNSIRTFGGSKSLQTTMGEGRQFEIKLFAGLPVKIYLKTDTSEASFIVDNLIAGQTTDIGQIELRPIEVMKDVQLTGILTGLVLNETNEPVAGASVKVNYLNLSSEDFTDSGGRFILKNLPVGKIVDASVDIYYNYGLTLFKIPVDGYEHNIKIYPQGFNLIGKPAPGLFVEKWLNCRPITLEQLKGKIILLQVGANLYKPEYLRNYLYPTRDLLNKYKDEGFEAIIIHRRPEINQLAVHITEEDIEEVIEKNNIDVPFGIDETVDVVANLVPSEVMGNGATYSLYEVKGYPAMYLIDRKGIVRACPTMNNLEEWIEKLIAEE